MGAENRYINSAGELRARYLGGKEGQQLRDALEGKLTRAIAPGRLPGLSGEESRNAAIVFRVGQEMGATPQQMLAAAETGLVESGFHNYTDQAETDLDSLGWRQERTSIYGTGPNGPTNVEASARRFFEEAMAEGKQPTAGALAQATQGSAFPERYDENEAAARSLLAAYQEQGAESIPFPLKRRSLNVLGKEKVAEILSGGSTKPAGTRVPTLIKIGERAEDKFGVEAREQPHFDPVDPVHTSGSMHYSGDAIDFQGSPDQLMALDKWLARKYGSQTAELFYDPGISISDGAETSAIGDHGDHVHFGLDESSKGVIATPVGGGVAGQAAAGAGIMQGLGGASASSSASAAAPRQRAPRAGTSLRSLPAPLSPSAPLPGGFQGLPGETPEDADNPLAAFEGPLFRPARRLGAR